MGRWACAQSLPPQSGLCERLTRHLCHSDFHADMTSTLLLPLSCCTCKAHQTLALVCSGNAQASFEADPSGFLVSVQSQSFQISPIGTSPNLRHLPVQVADWRACVQLSGRHWSKRYASMYVPLLQAPPSSCACVLVPWACVPCLCREGLSYIATYWTIILLRGFN